MERVFFFVIALTDRVEAKKKKKNEKVIKTQSLLVINIFWFFTRGFDVKLVNAWHESFFDHPQG